NVDFVIYRPGGFGVVRRANRAATVSAKARLRAIPLADKVIEKTRDVWSETRRRARREGLAGVVRAVAAPVHRQGFYLLSVEPLRTGADCGKNYGIGRVTLAEIASRSVDFPKFLTEDRLQEARRRLNQGGVAWLASVDELPRAVLWTH